MDSLEDLYARVPAIPDCRGRCWPSCGPIDMSDLERERIAAAGYDIPPWGGGTGDMCPALSAIGTCKVYALRPMICRLYGASEAMPCPEGCRPERWLSADETWELLTQAMAVGGHDEQEALRHFLGAMRDPRVGPVLRAKMLGQPVDNAVFARSVGQRMGIDVDQVVAGILKAGRHG